MNWKGQLTIGSMVFKAAQDYGEQHISAEEQDCSKGNSSQQPKYSSPLVRPFKDFAALPVDLIAQMISF
jgi:hypothetical protein